MVAGSRTAVCARRRRDGRGASAVEFALVMPLLFALLFGIVTCGFVFFRFVSLNDSVRAGARFGATTVSDTSWPATVQARTVEYSAGTLASAQVCVQLVKGPSSTQIQYSCALTGGSAVPPPTPAGLAATDCVVKVWAAQPDTISAPPLYSHSVTLHRGSVTRYERTC